MRRNKCRHFTLIHGADSDARLPGSVTLRIRLRIDCVQRIVRRDEQAADTTELIVRVDVVTILVKYLDAVVATVGNEEFLTAYARGPECADNERGAESPAR